MTLSENDPAINKMLSQCTNYDDIKRHLEKCIAQEKEDMPARETADIYRTDLRGELPKGYNRNQMVQSALTS